MIFPFIQSADSRSVIVIQKLLTLFSLKTVAVGSATYLVFILAAGSALAVWRYRGWHPLVRMIVGLLLALFLSLGLGALVARPRPFVASSAVHVLVSQPSSQYAFPSSHAAAAFALATAVACASLEWGWLALVLAVMVALGRVAVGVHYPSDVLIGGLIGIVSTSLIQSLPHHWLRCRRP